MKNKWLYKKQKPGTISGQNLNLQEKNSKKTRLDNQPAQTPENNSRADAVAA